MTDIIKKYFKSFDMNKIQLYLFALYLFFIYIFEDNGLMLKVSSLLLLAFIILEVINIMKNKKFTFNICIIFVFLFSFFCGLSCLWAFNQDLAIEKTITLFLLFIFLIMSFNYFRRINNGASELIKILAVVGIAFAVYILCYYGPITYFKELFIGERIGSEIENVNSIGIKMAITFTICVCYVIFFKKHKYLYLSFLPFIISIGSGSRKAILFIIISLFIIMVFFIRDSKLKKSRIKKILFGSLSVFIIIIVIAKLVNVPFVVTQLDRLKGMVNGVLGVGKSDHSTFLRISYINAGLEQFMKTPLFGIGIDNARLINVNPTYLHNNYVELLASVGLIGFMLYYSVYAIILYYFFKNIKKLKNYQIVAFIIFFTSLLLEYGMVTYYNKNTYVYILLCCLSLNIKTLEIDITKIVNIFKSPKIIILKLMNIGFFYWLNDKNYLKLRYRLIFNKKLNLDKPQTFNEKLQWLKLYDHNKLYVKLVDKYLVKDFVKNKIGSHYVIPTLAVYDSFDDINFSKLPNQFVIKCNHDSGGLVICKNKKNLNISSSKKKIEESLKRNYYYFNREWPYNNVKKKILIEKYMKDEKTEDLIDYKVMCFNGKAEYIFTCTDRFNNQGLKVTFFDTEWNKMPFSRHYPSSNEKINKPYNLKKMIQLSELLSKNIPFVRIDWYEINKKLYFGEMTFYPGSGFEEFNPENWDLVLGEKIKLPNKKEK